MKVRSLWAACGLLILALAACGKDDPTGPTKEEITGTWSATKVQYIGKTSPDSVDLIADGAVATMDIAADNTFEYVLTPSGGGPQVTTGTWVLSGDVFRATPTGMGWSWEWTVSLASGTLSLTGASAEYDCDRNGTPEEATWNLTFVR